MWLNSFCKEPLRLPMPAELEYWWEKVTFVGCNINAAEVSYKESSDMFDVTRDKGLLPNVIKRLPMFKISCDEIINSCGRNDFIYGDTARMMPMCNHIFHVVSIDVWLVKHDSCPTCRQELYKISVWLKE
ncbi:hypothetical protein ZIOFF_056002 [Zingiber officinale]|uniref:RING-type domain-containing protein n=1 Tax=Zingiber officinale TaxID=94328 RepID=A0A8J5KNY1_ZINOF|nr:hypothetical protein ZIOFF_056002 [Zingiber officinale]